MSKRKQTKYVPIVKPAVNKTETKMVTKTIQYTAAQARAIVTDDVSRSEDDVESETECEDDANSNGSDTDQASSNTVTWRYRCMNSKGMFNKYSTFQPNGSIFPEELRNEGLGD
jgi:hypothetical protein